MDLDIKNKLFLVGGATGGFGNSVAKALLGEGAGIIAVARNKAKLEELKALVPGRVSVIAADLTRQDTIEKIIQAIGASSLDGVFVNAGGPPPRSFLETEMNDWDNSYKTILRWKIDLLKALLPKFTEQQYGRIVLLESISVKQPVDNLVLSTSFRLAVVGFAKTLAREVADKGITVNILAPGYHATDAMNRLFVKRSEIQGISVDEARKQFESEIPVGKMGTAEELASLAVWLLSPVSRYITGQTISLDGGTNKGIFG